MKSFVTLIFIALFSVVASAQEDAPVSGYAETQTIASRDGFPSHQVNLYLTKPVTKKVSLYLWGQTSRSYSQVYAGAAYSIKSWIQVGAALGVEQAKKPLRGAGFVWIGKGRFSNLTIAETGGSGQWFVNTTNFQASKKFKATLKVQRFLGAGPEVEVKPFKNFAVYGGVYRDLETKRTNVSGGLRFYFP